MSGQIKIILDTNAVISILNGTVDADLSEYKEVFMSVITEIEFLSFDKISKAEVASFSVFKSRISTLYLNNQANLLGKIIDVRKKHKLKLPDAIIAATALVYNATLITNDKEFNKVAGLKIKSIK